VSEVVASRQAVRAAARRRRGRRGALISAVSTVVVVGGLIALVVTSPGWESVKQLFFSWDDFKRAFPAVLDGFWLDVRMFVIVEVVVLVLGLVVALVRTSTAAALFPLRLLAVVFTDVLRGVPTILLVFLIGFGVPALGSCRRCSTTSSRSRRTSPWWRSSARSRRSARRRSTRRRTSTTRRCWRRRCCTCA
jgi:ABC-type amino acid transport system permease subunit